MDKMKEYSKKPDDELKDILHRFKKNGAYKLEIEKLDYGLNNMFHHAVAETSSIMWMSMLFAFEFPAMKANEKAKPIK